MSSMFQFSHLVDYTIIGIRVLLGLEVSNQNWIVMQH